MTMSSKKREAIVKKAIKNFSAAIDSLNDIDDMTVAFGHKNRPDNAHKLNFIHLLNYWENAEWWKEQPKEACK